MHVKRRFNYCIMHPFSAMCCSLQALQWLRAGDPVQAIHRLLLSPCRWMSPNTCTPFSQETSNSASAGHASRSLTHCNAFFEHYPRTLQIYSPWRKPSIYPSITTGRSFKLYDSLNESPYRTIAAQSPDLRKKGALRIRLLEYIDRLKFHFDDAWQHPTIFSRLRNGCERKAWRDRKTGMQIHTSCVS
jgi:hypothetical protein